MTRILDGLDEAARLRPNVAATLLPRGRRGRGASGYRATTFGQLQQRSDVLAAGLTAEGATAGARVALLEGREVASGTTGSTTAKVTSLHGLTYTELLKTVGEDRARTYGQRAIDALGPFPGGRAKAALVEAVEFAIARAY